MLNLEKSNLRRKLLAYYFANTASSHYLRELAKMLDVDPTNLSRELASLARQGLFIAEKRGNQKYYRLNKQLPAFKELKTLVNKTIGALGLLKEVFGKLPKVKLALVYGSFVRGSEDQISDIDLFVVSDGEPEVFYKEIARLEKLLKREINLTLYSPNEFKRKKKNQDPFLQNVLTNRYEIIAGRP